jgi:ATPase subunit of ABC transporter with duplicated ATPase domains
MHKSISLKKVSLSFTEKLILNEATFKCGFGDKICIVGENGAGKSTLLKIIEGKYEPNSGTVDRTGHIRTYYIPQEFEGIFIDKTIIDYIVTKGGASIINKSFTIAKTLGIDLELWKDTLCGSLSGGQQKILALSTGLAFSPDFLLLDEPENHLDIVSRLYLMDVLRSYRNGVLFVSHDQALIDSVAQKVAEVVDGKIYVSEGGYAEYRNFKLERIAGLQRDRVKEQKRIKSIETSLGILEKKAVRGKNTAQFHARKEELIELRDKHKGSHPISERKTAITLKSDSKGFHDGRLLLRINNLSFSYSPEDVHERNDEHQEVNQLSNKRKVIRESKHVVSQNIFSEVDLELRAGKHVVLLGRNGSGKSTFLKCLTKNLAPTTGEVVWSPEVTYQYFDQHAEFPGDLSPFQIVMSGLNCSEEKAREVLGLMKFSREKMSVEIRNLSGGERMRVRFALVFGSNPECIILDEPTNHLDEVTWEILLSACNTSKSSIILVTHDYEFIEGIESKYFWMMKDSSVIERHKELENLIEELK